ncbi:MAG: GNAT family N-acetyltransferase [Tannerella sp.]|jgi:GNAT superfamily N-acetyltransferase|nr:GNAT family N-acetyltransferase [Tannerella sp.]
MSVLIKQITKKRDLKRFVKFNLTLYKHNPYHVPGLIDEEIMTLSEDKNPAFENGEAIYFMAYKDGKIAGRIAGLINRKSNETWNQEYARFGFVDFIDDDEVVDKLFGAVEEWAKSKGLKALHGPLGFTDMDHEGMLVHGFDQMSTMATIYNHPYYPQQLERIGYVKDKDWFEFKIYVPREVPEKHLRIGEIVKQKYGLKIVKFKKRKEIWPYAYRIFDTMNKAYAPLYGFTELTEKQINYYVGMYIPMLRLDFVTIVIRKEDDAVVGFGITMPNLSHALRKAKGRFFPFGFIHLLKALYLKPKVVDLYLIGVLPEYRNKGLNTLMFNDLIPIYSKQGIEYAESNPELETNIAVQSQWDYFRREHHKTRRAYIKHLL